MVKFWDKDEEVPESNDEQKDDSTHSDDWNNDSEDENDSPLEDACND